MLNVNCGPSSLYIPRFSRMARVDRDLDVDLDVRRVSARNEAGQTAAIKWDRLQELSGLEWVKR